jgi:N-acetyl-gamma-glutamyl-phosphate reductase
VDSGTRVVDASTAHRVADGWVYGLPELGPDQREAIRSAQKVSNPGCYATGVILGIRPLVEDGLIPKTTPLTIHAVSGYSGGGRTMIGRWEGGKPELQNLPFESPYALGTRHKHLPEMAKYTGLVYEPQFIPAVGPFITGMRIELTIHRTVLGLGADAGALWNSLNRRYAGERFVRVRPLDESLENSEPAFDPRACNGTNRVDISVIPNLNGHMLLIVQLDNLGKGASGAAVQNMNLMLGMPEAEGLTA